MKTKKFKTARGFLESHYDSEMHAYEKPAESKEAKIQRIEQAERNAIRALLSAIGLPNSYFDENEDLTQAIRRIQQMPEAQNTRHQHFLKGAHRWLKEWRVISVTSTGSTTFGPMDAA